MSGRRQPSLNLPSPAEYALLRPWRSEDATDLLLMRRDPLNEHYAGRLLQGRGEALARMSEWGAGWQDGTAASWAIVAADGQQLLGMVTFGLVQADLLTGSVGYELMPQARGRGLATAAVRAATSIVFQRLGWHRIELYHAVENDRSCAVARRAGYLFEGVMRSAMRYPVDGRYSDEHLHARIATDEQP
ncbi:GNAT family N-acetyltransferase [Spongisporangium articulatum]|uniref:GNAT family N-acetyltransferase n=1 Tax=Spongisporangium articulatum TaxID=3362603 RepID=A0ABW8AJW9_9ACTN